MGNSMKVIGIMNMVLIIALIVFILAAKQQTESGEKVSYFKPKANSPEADGEIVE